MVPKGTATQTDLDKDDASGTNTRLRTTLLVAAIAFGFLLRLLPLVEHELLFGDELTSILLATGHLDQYRTVTALDQYPVGEWTDASIWQSFLETTPLRGPEHILADLFLWDIHPPGYFLLLYGWLKLAGTHTWSGTVLNWLIGLATLLVTITLGRMLTGRREAGLLAGAVYALSPLAIRGAPITRPYELLTLLTVLFTFFLLRLTQRIRPRDVAALLFVAAAGLFTQYMFVVVLGAGVIVLAAYAPFATARRRWAAVTGLVATGSLALFVVLQLDAGTLDFVRYTLQMMTPVPALLMRTLAMAAYLFLPIVLVGVLALLARLRGDLPSDWLRTARQRPAAELYLLTTFAYLFYVALYLLAIPPPHAMGARYLAYLVPLLALSATLLLRPLLPSQPYLTLMLGALAVLALATVTPNLLDLQPQAQINRGVIREAPVVVVDYVHQPTLFPLLNADQAVYAAGQSYLLEHVEAWLPKITAEEGLLISYVPLGQDRGFSSLAMRETLLAVIDERANYALIAEVEEAGASLALYRVWP